jgi:pimeloyl-ACP methyl ester carboxylesterase
VAVSRRLPFPVLLAVLLAGACRAADRPAAAAPAAWHDPSPHQVRFVTVAPDVRLEVLDWGGTGAPLVFLAGLQDVAHGFDEFAPRFVDAHHVLAITRRGYGASSRPAAGYDVATRVADLRAVLDSLGLGRVTLVGHSIAGDELTGFAARYPERIDRLVYLDAAYDHSGVGALLGIYPMPPAMTTADSASPAAVQAYLLRTGGMRIPEAQLRAIARYDDAGRLVADVTPPSIDAAMLAGCGHPDYGAVQAAALVLNSIAERPEQLFAWWASMDAATQAKGRRFLTAIDSFGTAERAKARRGLRDAAVHDMPGANHYLFDSNEAEVEALMRAFLAGPRKKGS